MKTLVITALLSLLFISACSVLPPLDLQLDQKAKLFEVKQDKSLIYVYREDAMTNRKVVYNVSLDGKPVGQMISGGYTVFEVLPGVHTLIVATENDSILRGMFEAGKIYYLKQEFSNGLSSMSRSAWKRVPEEIAKAEIMKSSLVPAKS
jgi:hypothetical protein